MAQPAVVFQQVAYTYNAQTDFSNPALKGITASIEKGSLTAIIGHTGSGKSTLTKLVDGLLLPEKGTIQVGNFTLTHDSSHEELQKLHQQVGYVFQFPEKQLFSDTVLQDVEFGPLNLGKSAQEAQKLALAALETVHLPEKFNEHSPFELSGGQMRRVAIAGVLAMQPQILIMDEPTAGLDPQGQTEILELAYSLHEQGITVILVSHQMEQVATYADAVLVLNQGNLVFNGTPRSLFSQPELLKEAELEPPLATAFAQNLQHNDWHFEQLPLTVTSLSQSLIKQLQEEEHHE